MIESIMVPNSKLISIPETASCIDAINILEQHDVRCAPVLDSTSKLFRGNVYKYHIYKYAFNHPDSDLSKIRVTQFLKNTTRVVRTTDTLFQLIFAMNDLPYIAVLDEFNSFKGIVRHEQMLKFLSQAWARETAGYILTINTLGDRGELAKLSKLVNKYFDISACYTVEKTHFMTDSYIQYILPRSIDQVHLNLLVHDLEKKGYKSHYTSLLKKRV